MHKPSSSANGILLISNQYESTVMLTGERKLLVKQQITVQNRSLYASYQHSKTANHTEGRPIDLVLRECFKGDEASQWKRPKFDPSPHQNP